MQGIGPENVTVHQCRNLSRAIPLEPDGNERIRALRLLRHLQNLLVMFQGGDPEAWIRAAEQVRSWLEYGSLDYFDEPETVVGSPKAQGEEGEEEEENYTTDEEASQPRDGDDPGDGAQGGHSDYDYGDDDDDDYDDGGGYGSAGGSGPHRVQVAVRPSSSTMSSSGRS